MLNRSELAQADPANNAFRANSYGRPGYRRPFLYIGRTVIGTEEVVEQLEHTNAADIISANGRLVLPHMHRKGFGRKRPKADIQQAADKLLKAGATQAEIRLGVPYLRKQNSGLSQSIRFPIVAGLEALQAEYSLVERSLGPAVAGGVILDLRVVELGRNDPVRDILCVLRTGLPDVVQLSPPAVLELRR